MNPQVLADALPKIYEGVLPEFCRSRHPPEVFATCAECAMVNNAAVSEGGVSPRRFHADLKCCTYFPELPNYLVGGLLKEEKPPNEGRDRIVQMIRNRLGVSPAGIYPPKLYKLMHSAKDSKAFGNSRSLLCPYYVVDSGSCSIWKYRDAVCSTFFCKHSSGPAGALFWGELRSYLQLVERSLAKYALVECKLANALDLVPSLTEQGESRTGLSANDLDRVPPTDEEYRKLWTNWAGRESEFYIKCYEIVASLDREAFERILGADGQIRFSKVMQAYDLTMSVPGHLVRAAALAQLTDESGVYNIAIQNQGVTLQVPKVVLDSFDGKSATTEIIKNLTNVTDAGDAEEIIWVMHKLGILQNPAQTLETQSGGAIEGQNPDEGLAYEIRQ